MALSATQRRVLEGAVRKLERGPGSGWEKIRAGEDGPFATDLAGVHRWLESWITPAVQAVLDNDAGELHARELAGYGR